MAYADFTLTTFGEQWIAQAVQDAQDGTHLAVLVAMDFGESDGGTPPSMDTIWCSDTASLYTWQGSNVIGIRGMASNLNDTEVHYFNLIQIRGKIGTTDGIIAYCQSAQTEEIPAASVQQVTRVATVSLAVSGAATVTMATPQTGYAIEEEVAKIAPAVNVGGIILGDGNGHTSTIGCNAQSALTVSGSVRASGNVVSLGALGAYTGLTVASGGAQIVGDITAADDLTVSGTIKAPNVFRRVLIHRSGGGGDWYIDGALQTGVDQSEMEAAINACSGPGIYWSSADPAPRLISPGASFSASVFPSGTSWVFVCDRYY